MARRSRYKENSPQVTEPELVLEPIAPIVKLDHNLRDLLKILRLMDYLSTELENRVTVKQVKAFMYFAVKDALGEPKPLSELRSIEGFENMITRSMDIFLAPEKEGDEEMLDWLYRQPDPNGDKRNKLIRLTPKGIKACQIISGLLR